MLPHFFFEGLPIEHVPLGTPLYDAARIGGQFRALFPDAAAADSKLPRDVWAKARCGFWGCAYPRGKNEVVKFTADDDEAQAAERVRRDPIKGALPVRAVYRLRRRKGPPVFAIVSQRFAPPGAVATVIGKCGPHYGRALAHGDPLQFDAFKGCIRQRTQIHGLPRDEVRAFAQKTIEAVDDLRRAGIDWVDLHAGNVTQNAAGDPVIIDLGPRWIEPAAGEEIMDLARASGQARRGSAAR